MAGSAVQLPTSGGTAKASLQLVDEAGLTPPIQLLRLAGERWFQVGEVKAAGSAYERALTLIAKAEAVGDNVDEFEHGALALAQSRLLVQRGDADSTLPLFEIARKQAEEQGNEISAAAVTGDIARLHSDKGEVDEAVRLQTERLETSRKLGDLDGQAATLWELAQIELDRKAIDKAVPRIIEAYQIFDHLGRLEGICVIGKLYGKILYATGKQEEGLVVHRRAEDGFRKMHRYKKADVVNKFIAALPGS